MSRISIALLLVTLTVAGVYLLLQPDRQLPAVPATQSRAAEPALKPVRFQPMALSWGIAAAHQQGSKKLTGLNETLGAGLCVLDANGDHWPDLFFVGGSGNRRHYGEASWWYRGAGNRLFLNRGGELGFEDATEAWGLGDSSWGMGCLGQDLDGDGRPELLVYGLGPNLLYRHTGDGYELVEGHPALREDRWTTGASVGDFNRDGRPDIYLSNFIQFRKGERTFEAFSGFDVAEDAVFESTLYDAEENQLLVNQGDLQFAEQASSLGVGNAQGRSLGARWLDLNGDRWPDLLVMNQHGTPNAIFINQEGRGFSQPPQALAPLALGGSRDVQLVGRSGGQEYFFTRGAGFINALIGRRQDASSGGASPELVDVSRGRGLGASRFFAMQSWGAVASDFNNDGLADLYVANGQLRPDPDARHLSTGQPDSLLLGHGRGFQEDETNVRARRFVSSRAVVRADFDGDGRQDLAVAGNNSPLAVLRNVTDKPGRWLGVLLPADQRHGSTVRVTTEQGVQEFAGATATGFMAQSDAVLHVGLGASDSAVLEVDWPDARRTRHAVKQFDRIVMPTPDGNTSDLPRTFAERKDSFQYLDRLGADSWPSLASAAVLLNDGDLLRALYKRGGADLKQAILRQLEREQGLVSLQLLEAGLHEVDEAIVAEGLAAARRMEYERSIDWMIELFDRSESALVCRATSVLEHFYEQEEAAIRRKYLAVPPLMQMLNRPDVAACAARALGPAEKKRAVTALLTVLEQSDDQALRVQAIRSLGLIRDTAALAPLRSLPGKADAAEVAASLVARVRLGDTAEAGLRDLDGMSESDQLDVLTLAFLDEEAVVLSPQALRDRLARLLAEDAGSLSAVRAMAASAQPAHVQALTKAAASDQPEWRAAAYTGLARAGATDAMRGLWQDDLALIRQVLSDVPSAPMDVESLAQLLARGFPSTDLQDQLSRLSAGDFNALLESMHATGTAIDSPVLLACGNIVGVVSAAPFSRLPAEQQFSDAALDCFFGDGSGLVKQRDRISRRLVVRELLATLSEADQTRLRQKLASRDSFYAQADLFEPVITANADAWLAYLSTQADTKAVPEMRRLAQDRRLDTIVRTRALALLAARDAKQAELALQGLRK